MQSETPQASGVVASLGLDAVLGPRLTAYARLSSEHSTAASQAFETRAGVTWRF
jgi:hypothetical protein